MATSQTASIIINAKVDAIKDGRSTSAVIDNGNRQLANGTTANQADKTYYAVRTATAGYPDSIDLAGAGLIDVNGDAITLVEVTTFIIKNKSSTAAEVMTIGNGSNPFNFGAGATGTKTLKAGECNVLIDVGLDPAYTVTAGSADSIQVSVASGTAVEYEIPIAGRSA